MNGEEVEKVSWLSFWGNFGLAILKLSIGLLGYSRLLLADGVQSSGNAIMAVAGLIGRRHGEKPPDTEHPFGYGKVAFLLCGLVGLIVMVGAIGLLFISFRSLQYIARSHPIGLLVCLVSIGANELMRNYNQHWAGQLKSHILEENAKNNRFNTYSSIIIFISVGGTILGFYGLERIGAWGVAIVLLWQGIRRFYKSVEGLMDKLPREVWASSLTGIVNSVKGVKGIEGVKIKHVAGKHWVDLKLRVDPDLQISQADQVVQKVKQMISNKLPEIENIAVEYSAW